MTAGGLLPTSSRSAHGNKGRLLEPGLHLVLVVVLVLEIIHPQKAGDEYRFAEDEHESNNCLTYKAFGPVGDTIMP